MPVQIVGWVHGWQEWKRPFLGVAVGLVIDVVEDQAIHAEGIQALEGDISDLLGLLRGGRQPWRGQREEQELAPERDDATLEVHARKAIAPQRRPRARSRLEAHVQEASLSREAVAQTVKMRSGVRPGV